MNSSGESPEPSDPPSETAEARPGSPEPVGSNGCGTSTVDVGLSDSSVETSDGREREYRLRVPASYDASVPSPLVLDAHSLSSSGVDSLDPTRWEDIAEANRVVVVMPEGLEVTEDGPRGWNIPTPEAPRDVDDVAFAQELVDHVEATMCVDLTREYLTGFSLGGSLAAAVACRSPERFAGAATFTGLTPFDEFCDDSADVPILHVHGTADPGAAFDDAEAMIADVAAQRGCDAAPEASEVAENVERRDYAGCSADVTLIAIEGGMHRPPGLAADEHHPAQPGETILETTDAEFAWEWFQDRHLDQPPTTVPAS